MPEEGRAGAQLGLTALCKPVQGNFLEMPFADDTFDGAYAIEATCHANKARAGQPPPCAPPDPPHSRMRPLRVLTARHVWAALGPACL